jgi:hypothetical protein
MWQAYLDGVKKYGVSKIEEDAIQYVLSVAPGQKDRIKFTQFANATFNRKEINIAFKSLDLARVVQLTYPVTSTEPPMQVDYRKKLRLQFLDTGLLNYFHGFYRLVGGETVFKVSKTRQSCIKCCAAISFHPPNQGPP